MSSLDTKESEKNNNEDMNKPTTNVPVFMQQLRGPLKSLVERGGTKAYEMEINKYKEEMNKAKQSDPMPAWLANEMKVLGRYTSNESNNSPALETVKTTSSSLPSLNPGDRSPPQNYNQKKNDQDGSVPKISAVELKKDNEETEEVKQTSPFRTAKMPEWLITELKLRAKLKDTESIVPKSPSTKYQTASNTDPIQEASNTDPIQEASNTATIINSNTSNFNTTGNTVDKMNPPKHQVQNDDMQEMARKIALLTQYMEKLTQRFDNLESLLMNVLKAEKSRRS